MSDDLTDAHYDWVQQFCGMDARPSGANAPPAADAPAAPEDGTTSASPAMAEPAGGQASTAPDQAASGTAVGTEAAQPESRDGGVCVAPDHSTSSSAGGGDASPPVLASLTLPNSGGRDPCLDILEQLIELLNEVAQRFNDALNDPHNLYRDYRSRPHPDWGSWDGHRDRFYYDRNRLRQKIAEWEANDSCRGTRLTSEQQSDLDEAREFKDKEFPERPAPSQRTSSDPAPVEQPSSLPSADAVLKALLVVGLSAALLVTVIAALADPEPVTKLGLAGLTAEEIGALLVALGMRAAT